ncbi:MAG: hypothetical protein ACREJY_12570 [Candidatus Rokuibacteriota bacterium]
MSRTTPEEAFAQARAAMERGDWDGVFACLDPDNLLKISENGVSRFLMGGEATADAFTALCGEHDVPGEMVAALHTLLQRIAESARASVSPARAWATRRSAAGHSEDVGFVRRKGEWYIRVLGKRPGGGRG